MAGFLTNGLPLVASGTAALGTRYNQINGGELIPVDTGKLSGSNPQSVAATAFEIAALAAGMSVNTATSTAGASTQNTLMGRSVTEALTTAAAATYSYTLTNSTIAATSTVDCSILPLSSTIRTLELTSVTPASGSVVFVFTNNGASAINGTMLLVWRVS
mgnify:CR=1 FL=1